jgi:hypothetical protein
MSPVRTKSFAQELEEVVYDDGHFSVEHDNYYVACEGRTIEVGRAEFLLISRLVRNPARRVPAEKSYGTAPETARSLITPSACASTSIACAASLSPPASGSTRG